jgi:hypothetical protein
MDSEAWDPVSAFQPGSGRFGWKLAPTAIVTGRIDMKMKTEIGDAVSTNPQDPLVAIVEGPTWKDNRQQAKRINGSFICPECDLIWPMFEDVEEWTERDGKWYASQWGTGYGFCNECNIAVHEGFDEDYVIRL